MPIVGVRPTHETGWLVAPYPPFPRPADVILGWLGASKRCTLTEYEPNYLGDITPESWRGVNNFLLNVDAGGERAEMVVARVLPAGESIDNILAQVRAANVDGHVAFESFATIHEARRSVYLTVAIPGDYMAIGGLLLHVNRAELTGMRSTLSGYSA